MNSRRRLPIGVFDSGIGGLTVVRALQRQLPNERIVYFGDTARVPYGVKSVDTIRQYSGEIVDFLLGHEVKLLIVACNTMAAVAADTIRQRANVPVLDVIEAGASVAATGPGNRRIGVIGTLTTVGSGAYERAIRALAPEATVLSQACPLFVPLVEEGWLDHPVTQLTAEEYLAPLLRAGIDTLVLGCTHYPLLEPLLARVAGTAVRLIDSAETTAARARTLLAELDLLSDAAEVPAHRYFVTDVPQRFRSVGERFLGMPLPDIERVHW